MNVLYQNYEDDLYCVNQIKSSSEDPSDYIDNLYDKHKKLCHKAASPYFYHLFFNSGVKPRALENEFKYIVYKSAKSFDDTKGSQFNTWLYNQTRYFCLKLVNKIPKDKNVLYTDQIERVSDDQQLKDQDDSVARKIQLLENVKSQIEKIEDQRIKDILNERYLQPRKNGKTKSWKEISETLSIPSSTCIMLHNKGIEQIKELINEKSSD